MTQPSRLDQPANGSAGVRWGLTQTPFGAPVPNSARVPLRSRATSSCWTSPPTDCQLLQLRLPACCARNQAALSAPMPKTCRVPLLLVPTVICLTQPPRLFQPPNEPAGVVWEMTQTPLVAP